MFMKYSGKHLQSKKEKNNYMLEKIKKRWENCFPAGAHLYPLKWHKSEKQMLKRFERLLANLNLDNKTIIDYGCGGGYLGKYLLENKTIKKYIAFDIADRSVKRAKEQLVKYKNTEIKVLPENNHNIEFKNYKPDVFCCFACIIHFPTKEYLNNFLTRVNNCEAEYLILEIRNKNIGTIFKKNIYKTFKDGNQACITDENYVSVKLNNYKLYDKTDNKAHLSRCQILYFKRG